MVAHKKDKSKITRHHIIPKSRGGSSNLENIAGIKQNKHRAYHTLFDNQTPEEIVGDLANNYWNGKWNYVRDAYEGYKNGR